ncbi:hypothetical protein HAZT_HAZT007436 [Hyalella azteca]|uniref:Uncharacterized protein n=1 Tax=Hyalella azteca TaxID=294128 RepID=A0A6A0GVH0_HYAAZ|nr:hypothetical protein HAZT_HAZT007436 [Hyalella azteca]
MQVKQEVTEHLHASGISNGAPDPPPLSLEKKMFPDFRGCASRPSLPIQSQHGEYWILENYIPADLSFRCDESITYTTHGEYAHLDNIETITSRWQVWTNALPSLSLKAVRNYPCTATDADVEEDDEDGHCKTPVNTNDCKIFCAQGPVSIGLYAPGGDFNIATSIIMYLRDCRTESIRKYVAFHLIYHTDYIPEKV